MPQYQTSHVRQTPGIVTTVVPLPIPEVTAVASEMVGYASYVAGHGIGDAIVNKDGTSWKPSWTPNDWDSGPISPYDYHMNGIYTGDRFMIPMYASIESGPMMLQRKDGEEWSWDVNSLNYFDYWGHSTYIYGMASDRAGTVYAGGEEIGDGAGNYEAVLARSDDFGATWTALQLPEDYETVYLVACEEDNVLVYGNGNTTLAFSRDRGATWTDVSSDVEDFFTVYDIGVSEGTWFLAGYGFIDSAGVYVPLIRSSDPLTDPFVAAMSPWSGDYPPLRASGFVGSGDGQIYTLFIAGGGRMCATGFPAGNENAYIMISSDAGETWTEIGTTEFDYLRTDFDFEGAYIVPVATSIDPYYGSSAFGFGRWWVVNDESGSSDNPPLVSISADLTNFRSHQVSLANDYHTSISGLGLVISKE